MRKRFLSWSRNKALGARRVPSLRSASALGWSIRLASLSVLLLALPASATVGPVGWHGWIELQRGANPHGPHQVDITVIPQVSFSSGSLIIVIAHPYDPSLRSFKDTLWVGGAHAADTISCHYILPVLKTGRFSVGVRIEIPEDEKETLYLHCGQLFVHVEDTAVYTARGGFGPIDRQRIQAELQRMKPQLDSLGIAEATIAEVGKKAPWILQQVQERIGVADMMMPAWTFDSTGSAKSPHLRILPEDSVWVPALWPR